MSAELINAHRTLVTSGPESLYLLPERLTVSDELAQRFRILLVGSKLLFPSLSSSLSLQLLVPGVLTVAVRLLPYPLHLLIQAL